MESAIRALDEFTGRATEVHSRHVIQQSESGLQAPGVHTERDQPFLWSTTNGGHIT